MNTTPITIAHREQFEFIKTYCLREFGTLSPASLLREMMIKAEHDADYDKRLRRWFTHGGTLLLRDLAESFGSYFKDLAFANTVDGLDSAAPKSRAA